MKPCYAEKEWIVLPIPNSVHTYEIAFKRIDTPEKLLGWIMQLSQKRWVDVDMIRCLIETVQSELKVTIQWPS